MFGEYLSPEDWKSNPDGGWFHVNWAQQPIQRQDTNYFVGLLRPCSYWYGEGYPVNYTDYGVPYDRPTMATGNGVRDCSNIDQPVKGWFNTLTNIQTLWIKGESAPRNIPATETITFFNALQQRSWYLVAADPSVDPSLVGAKPASKQISLQDYLKSPSSDLPFTPPDYDDDGHTLSGILESHATRYFLEYAPFTNPMPPPRFQGIPEPRTQPPANVTAVPWFVPVSSEAELDGILSASLTQAILNLAQIDKTALSKVLSDPETFATFNLATQQIFNTVPHGGIYIKAINHTSKRYAFNLVGGTQPPLLATVYNFPKVNDRLLQQMTALSNAILRNSDPVKLGQVAITQGLRIMPRENSFVFDAGLGNVLGTKIYPFALSFLVPMFVVDLVTEKEARILIMMRTNGVGNLAYYGSHFVVFFVLYMWSAFIFVICNLLFGLSLLGQTSLVLILVLLMIWGMCMVQVSMTFFFSTFFNKSRLALVSIFIVVICSVMIAISIDQSFAKQTLPSYFFVWPPFAFYRALGVLNRASYEPYLTPYTLSSLKSGDEVCTAIIYLVIEIPILLLASVYLNGVLPSEF
eukprot:jgi/Hompol1/5508/HPOL_001953-RA